MNNIAFADSGTAYHPETGERIVWGTVSEHKLVSKAQAEAYKEREEFKGRQSDFTFTAMDAINEVTAVLTTAQCGYLVLLQCFVNYGDGTLVDSEDIPMSTKDMQTVLQLTRKRQTFYDFLNACLEHDIIRKKDDNSYSVNPRYHFRGATDNKAVIRSYTAMVKRVYREVRAVDLGLIYRMLPYVHYKTNALCANPSEPDVKSIRWFNGKELAAVLGINSMELSRRLPRMRFGDEYVVARLKVGGIAYYIFNPNVFYRKTSKPDDTLVAMFNVNYEK
ncbi:hypothetical protein LEY_84 [Paenibacillus phage Ley]|nr:hypothetical protein ASH_84 [Paenibacillus phage Ash]AXF40298.1 hypothetical protein LEY_84 [Paenibacillus phage Ley]